MMLRMDQKTSSHSLFRLVKKWRAVAKTLIGFGRALVRLEKTSAPKAWELADEVEISARAALAEMTASIHHIKTNDPPTNRAEEFALKQLTMIACSMLVLALLAQKIKRDLAGRRAAGFQVSSMLTKHPFGVMVSMRAPPVFAIPILDPG